MAFLSTLGSVEARKVYYEVDGQRYSYSTNNRQQTKEAHSRIEAAKARSSSRARGDAERAANPLAGIFGQAPRPAAEGSGAAEPAQAEPVSDVGSIRRRTSRVAERRQTHRETRAEKARERKQAAAERRAALAERRAALAERRLRIARERREKLLAARRKSAAPEARPEPDRPEPQPSTRPAQPAEPVVARSDPARAGPQPSARPAQPAEPVVARSEPSESPGQKSDPAATQALVPAPPKTISFDLTSGIKTIERTDGTLHEEPFDAMALAKIGISDRPPDKDLTDFVDRLRGQAE